MGWANQTKINYDLKICNFNFTDDINLDEDDYVMDEDDFDDDEDEDEDDDVRVDPNNDDLCAPNRKELTNSNLSNRIDDLNQRNSNVSFGMILVSYCSG